MANSFSTDYSNPTVIGWGASGHVDTIAYLRTYVPDDRTYTLAFSSSVIGVDVAFGGNGWQYQSQYSSWTFYNWVHTNANLGGYIDTSISAFGLWGGKGADVSASITTSDDYGNGILSSTPQTVGQETNGTILGWDIDTFRFDLTQGVKYKILLNASHGSDYGVMIGVSDYNGNGAWGNTSHNYNYLKNNPSAENYLEFTAPASGSYVVYTAGWGAHYGSTDRLGAGIALPYTMIVNPMVTGFTEQADSYPSDTTKFPSSDSQWDASLANNFDAKGGNDTVDAGGGNDRLAGGAGNDFLIGGTGDDHLSGGIGNDTLRGGAGDDALSGGLGKDTIDGGSGTDTVLVDSALSLYRTNPKYSFGVEYDETLKRALFTQVENDVATDNFNNIEAIRFSDAKEVNLTDPLLQLLPVTFSGTAPVLNGKPFNVGLTSASATFLTSLFGVPGGAVLAKERTGNLVDVDPTGHSIMVNGLVSATESLKVVFKNVGQSQPELLNLLGSNGMWNVRFVEGTTTYSNHSWAVALDLKLDVFVDKYKDGYVLAGLTKLIPFFNAAGWVAGAGFQNKEDGMHFEVSKETLSSWYDTGWITKTALLGGPDTQYSSVTSTLTTKQHLVLLDGPTGLLNGIGNAQANTIVGNKGNNVLTGLAGNDDLRGGKGNDTLVGGLGKDTMTGGVGGDKFDFNLITESVRGANRDVIVDFTRAQGDKIDLSTLDADTDGTAGNQAFQFIGATAFTGIDGQLRCSSGIIQGDTNGDKVADFEIQVKLATLFATDFIL